MVKITLSQVKETAVIGQLDNASYGGINRTYGGVTLELAKKSINEVWAALTACNSVLQLLLRFQLDPVNTTLIRSLTLPSTKPNSQGVIDDNGNLRPDQTGAGVTFTIGEAVNAKTTIGTADAPQRLSCDWSKLTVGTTDRG